MAHIYSARETYVGILRSLESSTIIFHSAATIQAGEGGGIVGAKSEQTEDVDEALGIPKFVRSIVYYACHSLPRQCHRSPGHYDLAFVLDTIWTRRAQRYWPQHPFCHYQGQ